MSLDFDTVRQSVDRIAASQEQMTRSLGRLAAGQEQTTDEITKLQEIMQYILRKKFEPPPPQASARAARSRSPQARTVH